MSGNNKYNARRVTVDGITFDSVRESERYQELKLMEQAREITWLQVHPRFEILPAFNRNDKRERPTYYEADFQYQEGDKVVVEDVKGMQTDVFRLKRKLFLFVHGTEYELRIKK